MPNFEVGGIDVAVEPQFRRFRSQLREQLREEERAAPAAKVEVEPKLSSTFRRELNRLVREASAGLDFRIEATPALSRNFRAEVTRLVREASAGVTIDVEARPVLGEGFRTELRKKITEASAGVGVEVEVAPRLVRGFRATLTRLVHEASAGVTVGIELFPSIPTGFRTMVERRVAQATTGLSAKIELQPALTSTFRTTLRRMVTEASRNAKIRVEAEPVLGRGFRVELRRILDRSTKDIRIRVPLHPVLARGFRAEADRAITKEMARYRANVQLQPVLGRNYRARMKALLEGQPAATVRVEITTESGREIRRKLIEAVRLATENPPITARVRIVPELGTLRRDVSREVQNINRRTRITPTVRSEVLRRRLVSDVSQTMAALNKVATLNITSVFTTAGRAGIAAATTALRFLRSAARLTILGLAGVAVGIAGVGTAGLKTAGDLELTARGFQIQLRSVEKGTTIFNQLVEAAKQTPFQLPDLTPMTNQLIQVDRLSKSLSFGDIIPTMRSLTDLGAALAISPANLNRFALALTKIAGRGKITGLELRSITNNIPQLNAIGLIAKDLGVSIPDAFDKISSGAVSSDRAIRVLLAGVRDFPGAAGAAAKVASETFKGALSNLPDILRLDFFEAFKTQLPQITAIIAPNGPLIQAFETAVPAFAAAFTPLAQSLFSGLVDFAPAIASLAKNTVPVFTQLGRASEALGLQTRRAFDNIGPGLHDLGESLATVLAGLSPVLPLIGDLAGLIASGLSRALDGLVSSGAIDALLGFFGQLHDLGARLLPIITQVVTLVGRALVEALGNIDLTELGRGLGDLVTAGGDLLVALVPLIPELVKIAALFAESLSPAIEASIPLVTAFITIVTPIAEVLARMGPGIIILVGIAKAAIGLGKAAQVLFNFDQRIKSVRTDLIALNEAQAAEAAGGATARPAVGGIASAVGATGIDTEQIKRGFAAITVAAAASAAAMSSYFAAASDDVTTRITGIATATAGIAASFAVGGPIGGGIAIVATGIGAIFGNIAKNQAKAREEAQRIQTLADDIQQSFKTTGVDTAGAKVIGIVDSMDKLISAGGKEGAGPRDFFGRFNADLAEAATLLATDQKAYRAYAQTVIDARVSDALDGNRQTLNQFSVELQKAADTGRRDLSGLANSVREVGPQFGSVNDFLEDVFNQFARTGSLDNFRRRLLEAGVSADKVGQSVRLLRGDTEKAFAAAQGGVFGIHLDASVRQAIRQQQELDEVQQLLKSDTEKATDAFTGFTTAATAATSALKAYNDAQKGDAISARDVLLNTIDAGKRVLDIQAQQKQGAISNAEAQAQTSKTIADAADTNRAAIGRAVLEANGDYDVFKKNLEGLRSKTLKGLVASFENAGLSEDQARRKAKAFLDKVLEIPDSADFNMATNLAEQNGQLAEFRHQLALLNQAKIKDIVANLRINMTTFDEEGHRHVARVVGFSAAGKLVRRPELSVVGEGGPELILPLTNPARMAQLLDEARRAGLLQAAAVAPGAGPVAPAQGLGLGLKPAVDPAAGKQFAQTAGKAIANLGQSMTEATKPGLDKWRSGVDTHLVRVVDRFGRFGRDARSSLQTTVTDLTTIASRGTTGVVGALQSGLSTGTGTIRTITRTYARSLANSLNPVLGAIGQPKINLGQFRTGGVNDPRIVPDGSYAVHVFGEHGTKGEAYIPFDPKLRQSSRAIADETVRRLGGHAQWFARGGISGDTVGLDPEFYRRLERWSFAVGQGYRVDSGYRSLAEQKRLYQRWLAGVPGQAEAAVPGRSMHNFGLASDGNRWGARRPGDYGLRYPMSFEPWHVEPNEARAWAGMSDRHIDIAPLPKVPSMGPYGALSIVAKKSMEFGYMQALAWAGEQMIESAPGELRFTGGSASEAAAASWIRQAMKITGVGPEWLSGLLTLTRRESGWSPTAINLWDSNARAGHPSMGIGQMVLSTFLAHALPGMRDIFNPVDNLVSVIRYILATYHSIKNVQQANEAAAPRGYEHGGISFREQVVRVSERNKPEVIIPLTNPARAMALADASGVSRMVHQRDVAYTGPKTIVEKVEVSVVPPAAQTPEAYAASMGNRLVPAVAAAIDRALP